MKTIYISSWIVAVLIGGTLLSLNTQGFEGSRHMILAGDSWGVFACITKAFNKAFTENNIRDVKIDDCNGTTKLGAEAASWLERKESKKIASLAANAHVLYLSLGGNDFLAHWNKNMSENDELILREKIFSDLQTITKTYLEINPALKILLSGYDYANFVDFTHLNKFEELFYSMGKPTPLEFNSAFLRLSNTLSKLADGKNIFYIHHYGIVHYWYGNKKQGLDARTTLPPEEISPARDPSAYGGEIKIESSKSAMLHVGFLYRDPFHLRPRAYQYLADHAIKIYLKDLLN